MSHQDSKEINKSKEDIHISFFRELEKVKDYNRSLVIVTHGFIELLINTIIDSILIHGEKITSNNRDYPQSVKLVMMHELRILDDDLYKILDWFRKIRNKAAHEPFFQFNKSDVDFANKSLDRFIRGESKKKPNDLFHFCKLLVGTIWNEKLDILLPVFEPELLKK